MAQKANPTPLAPSSPGISKRASPLAVGDRWIDADKVRFVDSLPEKIGGFQKITTASVTDPIRGLRCWTTLAEQPLIGMGTHRKLFVVDQSDTPADITPVESTGTLTNPFTVTTGSATVAVAHASHGRNVGDEIIFSGAAVIAGTGMTINGDYQVSAIIDVNNYEIVQSVASLGNGTGGGTVSYEYILAIGAPDPVDGDGYGAGFYGAGDYGAPSEDNSSLFVFDPRIWNLSDYGQLLLANPTNGGIYKFDPTLTPAYQRAALLDNAPTSCRSIFVTPERFLFALGANNDPLNIMWADQNDITIWTPDQTNTANSRRLQEGTRIMAGAGLANLYSGVWTDSALYQFQYTGSSFIYDSTLVGTNCGLVSPMALIVHLGVAYWMSRNNFLMWNGGVPVPIPNSSDVREFVMRALRSGGYEMKTNAYLNTRYNEIWWFYASTDMDEPGLYVAVSLTDFSWICGTLSRTSGDHFKGSDQSPILASTDGWLYQHETGKDADGAIMQAFIQRAPLQILDGGTSGEIQGIVTDMQRQTGNMTVEVNTFDRINAGLLETEREVFGPGDDLVDLRIGGRIAGITFRSDVLGGDFRLGAPAMEVISTGKRR